MENTNENTNTGAAEPVKKVFTRFFPPIARIVMGLLFLVAGANGLFHLFPEPQAPKISPGALAYMQGFIASGYMWPFIFGTMLVVGLLLLTNLFVPLALAVIAPVILNIVAFHIFLGPSGLAPGVILLFLELYLAWAYRRVYRPMLAMLVKPD